MKTEKLFGNWTDKLYLEMRPIFGNMTLGVTGLTVFGPLAPNHENPGIPTATGSTLVYDEFAPDEGLGGGGSDSLSSSRRQKMPDLTPGQQFRFGIRIMGKGLDQIGRAGARSYDQMIGRNDPEIKLCFRPADRSGRPKGNTPPPGTSPPGGPSPRRTRRSATKAPSDVGANWQKVLKDLERQLAEITKQLETKTDEAARYQQRAEEYAPAALELKKAKKYVRTLEALLQKRTLESEGLSREVATLRQESSAANEALEATLLELEKAKATAEENVALIRQVIDQTAQIEALQGLLEATQAEVHKMHDAVARSDQLLKLAGMEQKLRVRAEAKAQDLLLYLDSLEEGIGKHRRSLSLLLNKAVEANRRIESGMIGGNLVHSKELEELKTELVAKQGVIDDLKLQLLDAEALKAELELVRQELASAKTAKKAAQDESAQHQAAAEAAIAQSDESSTFQRDNEQLREELATARQEGAEAHEQAEALEVELARAREALSRSEEAHREAQEEIAKQRSAREAAEARATNRNELIAEVERLREQAAAARAEADTARQNLETASQEGIKQRKRATKAEGQAKTERARANAAEKRARSEKARADTAERQAHTEKARADSNQRQTLETSELRQKVHELETELVLRKARITAHAKLAAGITRADLSSIADSFSPSSDSGVSLHPEVENAFRFFNLSPDCSFEEFRTASNVYAGAFHTDAHKQWWNGEARDLAVLRFREAIAARMILQAYFDQKKSKVA